MAKAPIAGRRAVTTSPAARIDIGDHLDGMGGLMAATANVVMQLSRPEVGHGVIESTVESGQLTRHPLKRFRTTFTYLAVAALGRDDERDLYRRAVDRAHAEVRSGPGSPVAYNAFDPELQLWVAACLYRGAVDVQARLHGSFDDETADAFYAEASRFATTLQVPPAMWPTSRQAFESYWSEALERVSIDPPVRRYLDDLIMLRILPLPLRMVPAPLNRFLTAGFLSAPFREAMQLRWSESDQRRFDRLLATVAVLNRQVPGPLRRLPFTYFLWDMRVRTRLGLPLV